jgi:hypothetical protein
MNIVWVFPDWIIVQWEFYLAVYLNGWCSDDHSLILLLDILSISRFLLILAQSPSSSVGVIFNIGALICSFYKDKPLNSPSNTLIIINGYTHSQR